MYTPLLSLLLRTVRGFVTHIYFLFAAAHQFHNSLSPGLSVSARMYPTATAACRQAPKART